MVKTISTQYKLFISEYNSASFFQVRSFRQGTFNRLFLNYLCLFHTKPLYNLLIHATAAMASLPGRNLNKSELLENWLLETCLSIYKILMKRILNIYHFLNFSLFLFIYSVLSFKC